jgi:hypothetical protein
MGFSTALLPFLGSNTLNPEAPARALPEARNAYEGPWNFWHGVRTAFSTLAFLALICA